MKIAFPHMGTLSIAFMGALRNLGVEVVIPPRSAKNSDLVSYQFSPEFVCLPFKLTLNNFIEALNRGADTLVMIGGSGPCRLGYYSVIQEQILQRMGFSFTFIRLDDPDQLKTILQTMKEISGVSSKWPLIREFLFIMNRLDALDTVNDLALRQRPFETDRGDTSRLLKSAEALIDQTRSSRELRKTLKKIRQSFAAQRTRSRDHTIRIAILGEIFIVLESVANMNVEEKLGEMGAIVERGVTISSWFNERIHYAPWRPNLTKRAMKLARPYMKTHAGGESLLSVGRTIEYAHRGFDGIVHLMPFSCMPELIAQSIMDRISTDVDLPILHLSFDEHTSETGYNTRLEAFVDMLHRKRKHRP